MKDERLMIEGLKHTRMAFVLQNLVILGVIFYRYIIKGVGYEGVSDLLMLFMVGIILVNFLNLKQSVEVYESTGQVKRSYSLKLLWIPIVIAIVIMGINMAVTQNASLKETGIIGLIIFVCFLVPSLYAYNYGRKIRNEEDE